MNENVKPNILVIDDSTEMLELVNHYLAKGEIGQSHLFKNEYKALDFLLKEKVDLIIIDVFLDSITGFQVGKILRNLLQINVPIIYISSQDKCLREFYLQDQRNSYFMNKPFDQKTFIGVVRSMINGQAA